MPITIPHTKQINGWNKTMVGAFANMYLLNYSHILHLNVKLFTTDEVFCSMFIQCTAQQRAFIDTTAFEIKSEHKGTKDNMKQSISTTFQSIENDSSVWKTSSCDFKVLRDGLIFSAFSICSPIFQEHHKVIQTPQHGITLRYHFYNDVEVILTLPATGLPQEGHVFVHLVP